VTGRYLLRTTAVTVAAFTAIAGVGACSSSHKKAAASGSATPVPVVPKRWWTDAAGAEGSLIDVANPTAASAALKPDLPTYCKVLSDTLVSHNVFQSASGFDPGIVTASKAWIAEVSALAPTDLTAAWRTYSVAFLALLESGTKKSSPAFPSTSAEVPAARQAIVTHAKSACNLTISL